MNELFYCNCGNRGPDGGECPDCLSRFAFASYKSTGSGIFHLLTILISGFLGLVVGGLLIVMATMAIPISGISGIIGIIALACPFVGGILGNKYYKSLERKKRQQF